MLDRHYSFNSASRRQLASLETPNFFWLGNDRIVLAGKQQITTLPWHKWRAMLTKTLGILHI